MGIWDFSEYETEDLLRAEKLFDELKKLGLCFVDEDGLAELEDEIEERKFKLTDFGELTYEQEDLILEEGRDK